VMNRRFKAIFLDLKRDGFSRARFLHPRHAMAAETNLL
jgi:hypothetical protein